MTVSNTTNKQSFSGTGSQTNFDITDFVFADEDDLVVILRDESDPDAPIETTQTLTTHYTVNVGLQRVTMVTAPASDEKLFIKQILTANQQTDFEDDTPFPVETNEAALDKLTRLYHQLEEQVNRCVKMQDTIASSFDPQLPHFNGGDIPVVKSDETGFEATTAAAIAGSLEHGDLVGLGDDDHTQYLNEARHDALAADNPHSVTLTQAVAADSGTDVSAAELENLTDGTNADALHSHVGLADELVKGSANDTTEGYLEDKITTTEGVTQATQNDGANENVQIKLDVNGLTEETGIDTAADYIPFYDADAAAHRKIAPDDLEAVLDHNSLANYDAEEHKVFIPVVWNLGTSPAPTEDYENDQKVFLFPDAGTQELNGILIVPPSYNAGDQINMNLDQYSPSTSNTIKMQAVSTLIKTNDEDISGTTNQHTSTNSALTNSTTANRHRRASIDLTNGSGEINSVAVAAGDVIKIKLTRDSATDSDTADVRVLADSAGVFV